MNKLVLAFILLIPTNIYAQKICVKAAIHNFECVTINNTCPQDKVPKLIQKFSFSLPDFQCGSFSLKDEHPIMPNSNIVSKCVHNYIFTLNTIQSLSVCNIFYKSAQLCRYSYFCTNNSKKSV